jgi:hypothetical protein
MIAISKLESYNNQDKNKDATDKEARRARFRLLGPLGQGHNIVAHIRGSPARTKVFKELAKKIILIDNYTRWNSWYLILLIILNLKSQVKKYCDLYKGEL